MKDTLLEFIKFSHGRLRFYIGFAINGPWLIAFKLKLIPNQTAKERILSWFFRGSDHAAFQKKCDQFASDILPGLIRPKALEEIELLRQKNVTIVIVSASPENWIRPWTGSISVKLIATPLEKKKKTLPGRILDRNCHGEEKVRRINEEYQLQDYTSIYAYGD